MLEIIEISNNNDFLNLKSEWNKLILKSGSKNIFLTWEWLFNWWITFENEKELKILLVRSKKELIGIAPLFISKSKILKTYQIRFLGSTDVGSDYLDFIIKRGMENEAIKKIFYHLNEIDKPIINFIDMPSKSKNIELIKKHCQSNYNIVTQKNTTCPYIPLPESYEEFLQSLSSNMRYNIKRKRRKFEQKFGGKFVVIKEKTDVIKSFEELIRLNLNRMKYKNIKSPFTINSFTKFHRNILPYFIENEWIRFCFLKIKDKNIAALYIFKYEDKYYYYQAGFDPDWEELSPGFLLFAYCIENAIAEGVKEFDFLKGEETYKSHWTNYFTTNLNIKLYKKFSLNTMFYLAKKNKEVIKSGIRNSLYHQKKSG